MKTKDLSRFDLFLLKYSKFIDDTDMYLGPFADAAQLSASETAQSVGLIADLAHLFLLKGPFIALYLAHTRNFSALLNWIPRELMAFGLPYGGLIEVMRNYEKTCFAYYGLTKNYNI